MSNGAFLYGLLAVVNPHCVLPWPLISPVALAIVLAPEAPGTRPLEGNEEEELSR
jgi:hypothetical protein